MKHTAQSLRRGFSGELWWRLRTTYRSKKDTAHFLGEACRSGLTPESARETTEGQFERFWYALHTDRAMRKTPPAHVAVLR